ncbi:MAG: hypothetical protein HY513_01620 [Candidatus Aenigmarchaeota archaeon]|nr:hypothetical protein [Candidatus Aenigmarchaeota archaeon]
MLEVTPQELATHLTYKEIDKMFGIKVDGVTQHRSERRYAYFQPNGDIGVSIYGYYIPLRLSNYGFPETQTVGIKVKRVTGFSPKLQIAYDKLLRNASVPLIEAVETIAMCVNDSIEYDTDAVFGSDDFGERVKERIRVVNYTPNGQETVKGICSDAGWLIKTLFDWTLIEPSLRYTSVDTMKAGRTEETRHHDTTLIFDIRTAHWIVVNSKSPLKPYNIVPFERLQDLGSPYGN